MTVVETVLPGRLRSLALRVSKDDLDAVAETLSALGLLSLASRLICTLSGGQRQMIFLAQALSGSPETLLLDEPTSALDLRHQLNVLELMPRATIEQSLATIVVLHDLNAAARLADLVAVLSAGQLVGSGSPERTITSALVETVFGLRESACICPTVVYTSRRLHLAVKRSRPEETVQGYVRFENMVSRD